MLASAPELREPPRFVAEACRFALVGVSNTLLSLLVFLANRAWAFAA